MVFSGNVGRAGITSGTWRRRVDDRARPLGEDGRPGRPGHPIGNHMAPRFDMPLPIRLDLCIFIERLCIEPWRLEACDMPSCSAMPPC